MQPFNLDLVKYSGTWYELMHYDSKKSWFQTSDNYNTTAVYQLTSSNTMSVTNTTWSAGKSFTSEGSATYLGETNFRVDFPMLEMVKLEMTGQFGSAPNYEHNILDPNYIIKTIFHDHNNDYMFSIVSDSDDMLWVLSRIPNPPKAYYDILMRYMAENYDRKKLIQTPHFE